MDGFNVWSGVNISNFSQIGQEMAKLAFSLFVAYSQISQELMKLANHEILHNINDIDTISGRIIVPGDKNFNQIVSKIEILALFLFESKQANNQASKQARKKDRAMWNIHAKSIQKQRF